jgi:hypothetical protein
MSLAIASDTEIRLQLWDSFVTLLRTYAAAASLHGLAHNVAEIAECEAFVTAGQETLDVWCSAETGTGHWSVGRVSEDSPSDFQLQTDGTVLLGNSIVDMDHAAIQLISHLTAAAVRDRVEVTA